MNQFFLGGSSPYSQLTSSPNMDQNVQNQILGLDTNSTSSTSNPFGVEEQKDFGQQIIEKLGNIGRDIDILGDRGFQELGGAGIDTSAPFMTIGDKSFFLTKEGKADTSDNPSVVQKLLDDNKMTRDEATAARKTGDMILGTVAPAPEDGSTPAFIADPDDPDKKLRRLYSPITGGMLNQYGDKIAQDSLMQAVNPRTGKTFAEERRIQDKADRQFEALMEYREKNPVFIRTQESIDAQKAASDALQASIAQKDAARDLAQRARMLQMKPSELLAMETQAQAPAPQQSMYGAAQLIKALEGFPEAQAAIIKQFGDLPPTATSTTSTPTVDTTQTTTAPTTTTPKAKKTNIPDVPSAVEGSPQANSYIEQMIEKNPEESRESIIERLRREGIIFSPQQTVR